ncbi:MAG: DUF6056 family protein [Eubacteriales bacterium]|nr:DUF6056 family protein [Eubacteriales bacterium]
MKIWNKLKEQPDKWIFRILLVAFLGSMLPVWYLSRYTMPGRDDFTYGVNTHDAWFATHSLWEVLRAAAATTAESWKLWQGTWSSIFLMALTPGVFGERWYFLTGLIMTGMLGGSIAALVHVVLRKYVEAGGKEAKYQSGICILILIFLSVQTMVSPLDGIYWYNGALHYIFMESVLFFQAAVLLSFLKASKRGRAGYLILSVLLAAVLGGANLLTSLQSCILTVFLVLYEFWKKKKDRLWLLLPLLCNLVSFGFNVLAPGNLIRENTAEGMGAVSAILLSFYWAAVYITEWMTPIVLVGFALMLPVIWEMGKKSKAQFFHPLCAVFLSVCVFAAMFTPTLFATSSEGPDRCKNAMRVVLYLLVFLNLLNVSGRLAQSNPKCLFGRILDEIGKNYGTWLFTALLLLGAVFLLSADKNTYTSVSAVRSLVNGEAAQYYEENMQRLALYTDPERKDVTVAPLKAHPYLIFTTDVGNEGSEGYWINLALKDYYKLDSITVLEE